LSGPFFRFAVSQLCVLLFAAAFSRATFDTILADLSRGHDRAGARKSLGDVRARPSWMGQVAGTLHLILLDTRPVIVKLPFIVFFLVFFFFLLHGARRARHLLFLLFDGRITGRRLCLCPTPHGGRHDTTPLLASGASTARRERALVLAALG
jgi:hypothetical protein